MVQKIDPLADVAARIVADDPQIRARMKDLVNSLLDHAEQTIKYGDSRDVNLLSRQIVPHLLRSMQGADANASEAKQKAAYERIRAAIRGEEPLDDQADAS